MSEFLPFRKSLTKEQAESLTELLGVYNIEYELIKFKSSLDTNFGGGEVFPKYEIHLQSKDFEKVASLITASVQDNLGSIPKDHYLFDFTNHELYDILLKPDEWGEFDYLLTQKILKDRGETINLELINSLRRQRIDDLSKPEQSQKIWIYTGYFTSVFGGLLGVFIGWYMWKATKVLPNGEKVSTYSESDRKHGRNMLIIGSITFPIAFILRFSPELIGI